MHIGILQADSVLPQFQGEFGDYPAMFQRILGDAGGREVTFTTYDVVQGTYPASPGECDGYVITGSKMSVYDDEPWIHRLADYVVVLHEARVKTVGICFGHQMIAHALGGKTESASVGWCVGIQHSRLLTRPGFVTPPAEGFKLVVSHKDQVTQLPPGAELLATGDCCPNAMFRIGEHMLALQGHPEFRKGYSRALMQFRRDILGENKFAAGISSLDLDMDEDVVAAWIVAFIKGQ
jgi:GMP synthase-like glutamine amidotransferase